jgi:predicted nucleotidyltransferase
MNAVEKLKIHEEEIKIRFGIKTIGVFGSFAKGLYKAESDVDILVEFEKPVDIFEFIEVKDYLEKLLERKVDLVTTKALKPSLREKILNEVVYV